MSGEYKFALTSMEMGLRAVGTAEFFSLDAPANYERTKVLLTHLKRILPGVNTEGYTEWMGMRPTLPDAMWHHAGGRAYPSKPIYPIRVVQISPELL